MRILQIAMMVACLGQTEPVLARIPEFSTFGMLAIGLIGLGYVGRRREPRTIAIDPPELDWQAVPTSRTGAPCDPIGSEATIWSQWLTERSKNYFRSRFRALGSRPLN